MKKLLSLLFIISIVLLNIPSVKADNTIPTSLSNVGYLYADESPKDYMNYFGGNGYQPRIKYVGADKNHIDYYLFCLSFEKLAPTSAVNYTLSAPTGTTITEEQKAYAYIIENGFYYRSHSQNYQDLLWDYYVTSMAIYQYQYLRSQETGSGMTMDSSFVNIDGFNTSDTIAKNAIVGLANRAHTESKKAEYKKFVAVYTPSDSTYQTVAPAIIYEIKEEQIVPTPSIQIEYYSKCNPGSYVDAQMKLYNGTTEIGSWNSSIGSYRINDLAAGTYTLKDITNNKEYNITVKNQANLQTFSFTLEEICEAPKKEETPKKEKVEPEKKEESPKTGVQSILLTAVLVTALSGIILLYTKKNKIFKI